MILLNHFVFKKLPIKLPGILKPHMLDTNPQAFSQECLLYLKGYHVFIKIVKSMFNGSRAIAHRPWLFKAYNYKLTSKVHISRTVPFSMFSLEFNISFLQIYLSLNR